MAAVTVTILLAKGVAPCNRIRVASLPEAQAAGAVPAGVPTSAVFTRTVRPSSEPVWGDALEVAAGTLSFDLLNGDSAVGSACLKLGEGTPPYGHQAVAVSPKGELMVSWAQESSTKAPTPIHARHADQSLALSPGALSPGALSAVTGGSRGDLLRNVAQELRALKSKMALLNEQQTRLELVVQQL